MKTLIQQFKTSIPRTTMIAAASMLSFGSAQARPLGVDVSNNNGGGINWGGVKGAGFTYAWAKATEGTYFIDPDFTQNENNGKGAGMVMGAYDFSRPDLSLPGTEAGYFWGEAGGYIAADGKTLMPTLDYETFNGVYGGGTYSQWANSWCTDIKNDASAKSVTITPVIYTSTCGVCNLDGSVAGWIPWIANPNGESSQTGTPWTACTSCDVWGSGVWDVWQYYWPGSAGGTVSYMDQDAFNGSSISPIIATAVSSGEHLESLGGVFTANIASCSWSQQRLDLFGVGVDGGIWTKWYNAGAWGPSKSTWLELPFGTGFHGDMAAVSWAANRIDIFVKNAQNNCMHAWYDVNGWNNGANIENRGGAFAPTIGFGAASWGAGRIDVYGVGTVASNLYTMSYSGTWSGWASLGGTITATPGAVSWGVNRIDIFGRGTDGNCHQIFWGGSGWSGWLNLGGAFENYGMGVASEASGELEVFGVGAASEMYQLDWNNGWNGWAAVPSTACTSGPTAVAKGPNIVDIVTRGTDNACWHIFYQ